MNTKLTTSRMRTGQWADIIKDCKKSGLKVDDYCAQHGLSRNAYFYWLRKVKEAALTQSGFVEVRQQVEVSSCYPSPKLTASVNEIVLGIDENTPMHKKLLRWKACLAHHRFRQRSLCQCSSIQHCGKRKGKPTKALRILCILTKGTPQISKRKCS